MNRISVFLLLLAIGVQSATLHSQRAIVADPVELAHFKVLADVEVDKMAGRCSLDWACDPLKPVLSDDNFSWQLAHRHDSFGSVQRASGKFQRGPPALI